MLCAALISACVQPSLAGFSAPAAQNRFPEYRHSLGYGPSVGWNLTKDAWFWGASTDYGYSLNETWSLGVALTFDQETESRTAQPDKKVNTFSGQGTVTWHPNEVVALTTGFAKGFLDDDNPRQQWKFNDGDLGTGLSVGFDWPWTTDRAVFLSGTFEYNITQSEFAVSFDAGISLAF